MATLTAGISRENALALLREHNKEDFHIEHGLNVGRTLEWYAHQLDPVNREFWYVAGLLHDLDWEEDPVSQTYTLTAEPWLRAAGGTDELVHAIQSHNCDNAGTDAPNCTMEKVLYAIDELTGLIGAAVLMRPSKSVMDLEVKSLKKKFKDKRFAAGCSREVISRGAEMLGWSLDELFEQTIAAMQSFAPDRETFWEAEDARRAEEEASKPVVCPVCGKVHGPNLLHAE